MDETTPNEGVSQVQPTLAERFATHMGDFPQNAAVEGEDLPPPVEEREPPKEAVAEDAPEEQPAEEAETKTEETSEPEITTMAELAKVLDTTPDELLSVRVPVKIDGKDSEVALKDIVKNYQLEGHVNNKSIEVSNKLKEIETRRQQFMQAAQQQVQMLTALEQAGRQQILQEFNHIDWATLQATDPVEYATKRIQYQDRENQLNAYLNQVQQQSQQLALQAQQQMQAKVAEEMRVLIERQPAWANEDTRKKDFAAITSYLREVGFSPEEINSVNDHRILMAVHDAARYRALQAAKPAVNKQVREAPKMAKPGTRTEKSSKGNSLTEAIAKYRKTNRSEDAAAAFGAYVDAQGWS